MTVLRGGRCVIDDVSFSAREGEVLAILGPNGAGKTTMLEALVGLVPGAARALRFGGERIDPVSLDGILERVRESARKGVTVVASIHQMAIAERIADRVVILHEGRVVACGTREELGPLEEAFRGHVTSA